jgi:hypothetical protein
MAPSGEDNRSGSVPYLSAVGPAAAEPALTFRKPNIPLQYQQTSD